MCRYKIEIYVIRRKASEGYIKRTLADHERQELTVDLIDPICNAMNPKRTKDPGHNYRDIYRGEKRWRNKNRVRIKIRIRKEKKKISVPSP